MKHIFIFTLLALYLPLKVKAQPNDYIYIQGDKFMLNGQPFFVKALNYKTDVAFENNNGNFTYYLTPHGDYTINSQRPTIQCWGDNGWVPTESLYNCTDPADCEQKIYDDLYRMKNDLGINAVRWICPVGFGPVELDKPDPNIDKCDYSNYPAIEVIHACQSRVTVPNTAPYQLSVDLIETFLEIAEDVGIKVQILIGGSRMDWAQWRHQYTDFLKVIATYFANNTTLYSYDFYNEPNWFDYYHDWNIDNDACWEAPDEMYSKSEICAMVSEWHHAVKDNAPNHLTTLGLIDEYSVFDWDPTILGVDFYSFHLYVDENTTTFDPLKRKIRWIGLICDKPWMIGETGFSAGTTPDPGCCPHQGNLQQQADFAQGTLEMVRDCGGAGWTWWQYVDVEWEAHTGVYDNYTGALKQPLGNVIASFDPGIQGNTCTTPSNYWIECSSCANGFSGTITDNNGTPVPNAVIKVQSNASGYPITSAFSYSNGQYSVKFNGDPIRLWVSAPGLSGTYNHNSSGLGYTSYSYQGFHFYDTPANLNFTNASITNGQHITKDALVAITTSGTTVHSGGELHLHAGNFVRIESGFHSVNGSIAHAAINWAITPCDPIGSFYKTNNSMPEDKQTDEQKGFSGSMEFNIYPNPSNDVFQLKFSKAFNGIVEVLDLAGKKLFSGRISDSKLYELSLGEHSGGTYILMVFDDKGSLVASERINLLR